jgi:hypothetical protein
MLSFAECGGGGNALRQHVRSYTILHLNLDGLST